jgi:hypothetical protein
MSTQGTMTDEERKAFEEEQLAYDVKLERGRWLAVDPRAADSPGDMALLQNVYLSNLKGGSGWGKDITPAQCYVLAVSAKTTGLNPLLGEIMMLGGNVYATEAGILANATRGANAEVYEGYDLEPLEEAEAKKWGIPPDEIAFKCTVYRKDRPRPTIGVGHASEKNVKAQEIKSLWLSEMAQKRAIERAHSRAFPLPFNGVDEPRDALNLADVAGVVTIDSGSGQVIDERDSRVAELKKLLGWTTARVDLEYRNCSKDKDQLIARMEAAKNNPNVRKAREARENKDPEQPLIEHAVAEAAVADDLEPPEPVGQSMTKATNNHLFGLLAKLGIKEKADRLRWAARYKVVVTSFTQIDERVGAWLCERAEAEGPSGEPHEIEEQPGKVTPINRYANVGPELCAACEAPAGGIHAENCPEIPGIRAQKKDGKE